MLILRCYFFLFPVSCENLTPLQRDFLVPHSQSLSGSSSHCLPIRKTAETGTKIQVHSFFSLTRHMGDARSPASTATAARSVPQSRTAQQSCHCHRGLCSPPGTCHPLNVCGSFCPRTEQKEYRQPRDSCCSSHMRKSG